MPPRGCVAGAAGRCRVADRVRPRRLSVAAPLQRPRAQAWLSQWQPTGWASSRLVNSVHKWVADPRRVGAAYRTFVVNNAAIAVVWGAAFVGIGYMLTARWYRAQTDWTSQAAALTGAGVILGIALTVYQHRHSADHDARGRPPT
jgi:hypothetical protein